MNRHCTAYITIEVPCTEEGVYADETTTVTCNLEDGHVGQHQAPAPTDQPALLTWGAP